MNSLFFKQKPVAAITTLAKKDRVWYPSILCKEIDCTYPHMINTLAEFESAGLITTEGQGRIKVLRLTQLGEEIANDLSVTLRRLDGVKRKERPKSVGKT
jgi:DNA-binding MarR family transcriptional regulator